MRRYVPWLLLGVLTVAGVLGLGLGLAEAPSSSYAACQSGELAARITSAGSVASQPWSTIAFTNDRNPCSIEGYPRIVAASGHTYQGSIESLPITVIEGPLYERTDPGPHLVDVAEGPPSRSPWVPIRPRGPFTWSPQSASYCPGVPPHSGCRWTRPAVPLRGHGSS